MWEFSTALVHGCFVLNKITFTKERDRSLVPGPKLEIVLIHLRRKLHGEICRHVCTANNICSCTHVLASIIRHWTSDTEHRILKLYCNLSGNLAVICCYKRVWPPQVKQVRTPKISTPTQWWWGGFFLRWFFLSTPGILPAKFRPEWPVPWPVSCSVQAIHYTPVWRQNSFLPQPRVTKITWGH